MIEARFAGRTPSMPFRTLPCAMSRVSLFILFCLASADLFAAPMIIERVQNLPAGIAQHRMLGPIDIPASGKGLSHTDPVTGLTVTRLTEESDRLIWRETNDVAPPKNHSVRSAEEDPTRGVTNGYSRYSCFNAEKSLFLAYSEYPELTLYGADDYDAKHILSYSAANPFGEPAEPRWSRLPGEQDVIYFHTTAAVFKQNVREGLDSQELIVFPEPGYYFFSSGAEAEISNDGRYYTIRLQPIVGDRIKVGIVDLVEERILPGLVPTKPNAIDISPSGDFVGILPYYGPEIPWFDNKEYRFYRMDDLKAGDLSNPIRVPSAITNNAQSIGHNGWAWDKAGNEVFVYQDNRDDWFKAWSPATGEQTNIIHMSEMGWGTNQHIGSIRNPECRGWFFMSTYGDKREAWAQNQLMMIEILPHDQQPRIWRLGHTLNRHLNYFSEAFASVTDDAQTILWGANWLGTDNLEIFKMDLPTAWWETLNNGEEQLAPPGLPLPTPDPNAEVARVREIYIYNAETEFWANAIIPQLPATLDLTEIGSPYINIAALLDRQHTGSVRFDLDGQIGYRIENYAPYSIGGDHDGNFFPWKVEPGFRQISLTPYTGYDLSGKAGETVTFDLTFLPFRPPPNTAGRAGLYE